MNSDSWRFLFFILPGIALSGCAVPEERRSALVPSHSIELGQSFDLVDVRATIPDIAIDLRYATADNFVGAAVYPPTARAQLVAALLHARAHGLEDLAMLAAAAAPLPPDARAELAEWSALEYSLRAIAQQVVEEIEALGFKPEVKKKLFRDNALRVYKLKG